MPLDRARPPTEILYPVVQNATENPDSCQLCSKTLGLVAFQHRLQHVRMKNFLQVNVYPQCKT